MAYFADLEPCTYFGSSAGNLVAVGWLEPEHVFSTGPVPDGFFAALVRLLTDPWQPVECAGFHRCPFCRFTGGLAPLTFQGSTAKLGSNNLFVPARDCVYAAPSLIAHYVDAHEYAPPPTFIEAVTNCPEMRTMAYLKAMRSHGLKLVPAS